MHQQWELWWHVGKKDAVSSTAWIAAPWEIMLNGSSLLTFYAPDKAIMVPDRSWEASARKPADGPRGKSLVLAGLGFTRSWRVTVSAAACRYVWIRSPLNFTAWLLWSSSLGVIILDLMNLLNCKPDWNISRVTVSRAVLHGKKGGEVMFIWFFPSSPPSSS